MHKGVLDVLAEALGVDVLVRKLLSRMAANSINNVQQWQGSLALVLAQVLLNIMHNKLVVLQVVDTERGKRKEEHEKLA